MFMHLCFHKICFQFWMCFINKSLKRRCMNRNRDKNFLLEIISPHYDTALIIQFTASVLNGSNEKWGHINLCNSTCCSRLVFCFQNWSYLLWQKKCFSDREKPSEIRCRRPRICKNVEITWMIYSNSESLKKKSKQIVSLTYSWRFLRYDTLWFRLKKK